MTGEQAQGESKLSGVVGLVRLHLSMRPLMEAQDVIKLLFHGAFGVAHAMVNPDRSKERLMEEIERNEPILTQPLLEPLCEPVDPERKLVRVNLRPYLACGGSPEELFGLMERTAAQFPASPERFLGWLEQLEQSAPTPQWAGFPLACSAMIRQATTHARESVKSYSLTPPGHSEGYLRLYRPAYRVAALDHSLFHLRP